jgi:hypothetical protein
LGDIAIASTLAVGGIAMTSLPVWVVAGTLAAAIAFAIVLDQVKVPVFVHAARQKLAKLAEVQEDADAAILARYCARRAAAAVEDLAPIVKLSRLAEGCTPRQMLFFVGGVDLSLAAAGGDDA